MAKLIYIVGIDHKDKGIGFTAKRALQSAQRQLKSPILQAQFHATPIGSHTDIEVTIDDGNICDLIRTIIEKSGTMPNESGMYSITKLELQVGDEDLKTQIKALDKQYNATKRKLDSLIEENAKLREGPKVKNGTHPLKIGTPLAGLLSYFDSTNYTLDAMLDDPADLSFAQKVSAKAIENTFVNYANHIFEEIFSEDDIEELLSYDPNQSEEFTSLRSRYEDVQKELDFLNKLKTGDTDIPLSLRPEYIRIIEAKGHDVIVNEYKSAVEKIEEKKKKQTSLKQLKSRYEIFSEHLNEGSEAEVPVIFSSKENALNVYFPFNASDLKTGFIGNIQEELKKYFDGATVEPLNNKYVAYSVTNGKNLTEGIESLVAEAPVSLRVAGYNKIIPYRLG